MPAFMSANSLAQNNNHWCRDCGADLPTMPEVELSKSAAAGLKTTTIGGGGGRVRGGSTTRLAHDSKPKRRSKSDAAIFLIK